MDMHQRLKQETHGYHQQIEGTILLNKLANDSIKMSEYHLLIQKFHAYIMSCEACIHHSSWAALLEGREKTSKLTADLSDLKLSTNRKPCENLPPLITKEEILGYLYVMEGATLGGQINARILENRLGLTANYGARYFNGYGDNTRDMWYKFCDLLNNQNLMQQQPILFSATMTYTTLIEWMKLE